MAKITKISEIKPENNLFVFDKEYNDKRPTLYQVSDFIDAYKERPEDFGKAVMAVHTWPKLDKDWIKEAINDYLNDHAIESEEFYGGEDFTIDDLWNDETLRLSKIVEILENMLFRSGYFLKPCDALEIDYSELATAKPEPEPEPEPTPGRTKIELKPCPFCGSSSNFSEIAGMFIVRCCECGISTQLRDTLEEAAAEWNRRVNSTKDVIK